MDSCQCYGSDVGKLKGAAQFPKAVSSATVPSPVRNR